MILAEGVIRKISFGENLKDAMVYEVGKLHNHKKYIITRIVFSQIESYMYDCPVYVIYCKEGDSDEFIWNSFVGFKNCKVEYER